MSHSNKTKLLSLLIFHIFFGFSPLLFGSTSTVGTQNTFGAQASGSSTDGTQKTFHSKTQKQEIQNQVVHSPQNREANSPTSDPLKSTLIQYYKNLVLDLINKNLIHSQTLKTAIEKKDLFFENFADLSSQNSSRPHLTALHQIKSKAKPIFNENELEYLLLEFLRSELNKLQNTSEVLKTAEMETEKIFAPKNIHSFNTGNNFFYSFNHTTLQNGDLLTSISNGNTDEITLFNLTRNTLIHTFKLSDIINQSTLIFKFTSKDMNFKILKNKKDELVAVVLVKGALYTIDLFTQKILLKPHSIHPAQYFHIYPDLIELDNGQNVFLAKGKDKFYLVDLETGNKITFNKNFNLFGLNTKIRTTELLSTENLENGTKHFLETTLYGKKILILNFGNEIIFIDPNTGEEIFERFSKLNNNNLTMDFSVIQINNKTYIRIHETDSYYLTDIKYLIDLETGKNAQFQSGTIEISTEKHTEELGFALAMDEDNSKILFLDKTTNKEAFPSLNIEPYLNKIKNQQINSRLLFKYLYTFIIKNSNNTPIIGIVFNDKTFFIHSKTGELLYVADSFDYKFTASEYSYKKTIKDFIFYIHKNEPILLKHETNLLKFISLENGMEVFNPIPFNHDIDILELVFDSNLNTYSVYVNSLFITNLIQLENARPFTSGGP